MGTALNFPYFINSVKYFTVYSTAEFEGTAVQRVIGYFFFLLTLQSPLGVVFYSPLVGFSLLACEVS